ncbi:polyprenol monophosphomannose synthase [bacterium]|nr:polyprenol monophosphomannose synthase [bacterium]
MDALVVVPTYNEEENVREIINAVLNISDSLGILIVDDNSPDGTGDIAEELAARNDRVYVIHREKKMGLGSAYIAGFKWGLSNTQVKYILEMDADFSHNPEDILRFLKEIKNNDLVVGSRYLKGITVVNWPLRRLILSYGANLYTRIITGLPLTDSTGGFKCFRREVLQEMPLDKIRSDGYSFQIEINFLCWRKGLRIKEIPVVFTDRRVGVSKMSKKIVWEAVFLVWRLRFMSFGRMKKQN